MTGPPVLRFESAVLEVDGVDLDVACMDPHFGTEVFTAAVVTRLLADGVSVEWGLPGGGVTVRAARMIGPVAYQSVPGTFRTASEVYLFGEADPDVNVLVVLSDPKVTSVGYSASSGSMITVHNLEMVCSGAEVVALEPGERRWLDDCVPVDGGRGGDVFE